MKVLLKACLLLIIAFQFSSSTTLALPLQDATFPQKPEPAYAKWGRLAMQETKARYPNAQIIDYLHIGKTFEPSTQTEKFKLWLREGQREYGVYVNITFDSATQRVIQITYVVTDR